MLCWGSPLSGMPATAAGCLGELHGLITPAPPRQPFSALTLSQRASRGESRGLCHARSKPSMPLPDARAKYPRDVGVARGDAAAVQGPRRGARR